MKNDRPSLTDDALAPANGQPVLSKAQQFALIRALARDHAKADQASAQRQHLLQGGQDAPQKADA